jgi:hypothetical protein
VRIVGMLTWLWDGGSGVRIPAGLRDFGRMRGQPWLQLTYCPGVSLGSEEGDENVRMVELRTEIRAGCRVNTKQKFWSHCSGVDW